MAACTDQRVEQDNNSNLRKLIREATAMSYSHILLMGDFNYPDINWKNWTSKTDNIESQEFKFIECIRDSFLTQHVQDPTRVRGEDTPNLLDLIFTNEKNMIDSIEHQSPLGKSDHSVLTFQFNCYTELTKHRGTRKNFVRADYENIKKQLNEIQWKAQLEGKMANKQWNYFKEKITNIFDKYVPKKTIKLIEKNKVYHIIKRYW